MTMTTPSRATSRVGGHTCGPAVRPHVLALTLLSVLSAAKIDSVQAQTGATAPGAAGAPYPDMPAIAPIGVRIGKYMEVPEASKGPALDPAKGYRIQKLGDALYMITDNAYQSMFMVYEDGVVVVDAPPTFAKNIRNAIA